MEFKGLMNLTLVTKPILKSFATKNGGTQEYYELCLTDGYNVYNRVSGSSTYNFTNLEAGRNYNFAIMPKQKNYNTISGNGGNYSASVLSIKIVGVPTKEEVKKYLEECYK